MSWTDEDIPDVPSIDLPSFVKVKVSVRNAQWNTYECEICKAFYREDAWAYRNIYYHLLSKEHRERMELHAANYCSVCCKQFNFASQMAAHLVTKRHKQKEAGTYTETIRCEPCDRTFTCPSHYQYHISTRAHARKLLPPPQRSCDVCGIKVTTDKQMEAHFATKKHQKLSQMENLLVSLPPEPTPLSCAQ